MPLAPGARIGNYEVDGPLGAGGMGEVYRARDTRLDRSVAIKALPEGFATDAERLARFEREAKLLASLNHANIAAIYGLEEADGVPHLVLELVGGESLAQTLARGPIPVKETLSIGQQIASAIEAAHDRGIIHRDLKPGNVMRTEAGVVKVLDFGLAKGEVGDAEIAAGFSGVPTRAVTATGAGTILGTASYMSPEQARGKPVDRGTDVWALGCVLFECLTGKQTFPGETTSDVIARILEREPDWNSLPGSTPPKLVELIRRCLTKEVDDRPHDMGDLRRELNAIALDQSTSVSLPAASIPSLAVLYFENLADDKESEYFCAGITEDILTDLSKIKRLRVSSRNAVARYRGSSPDLQEVARELGVGAVLEGSVRRVGDRVRITAQLIDAADGFHLWAERYDRTLADVFAVQEEIASSIAEALRVALTPTEEENLVRDRPKDARAYDLYLKGRERYGSYSRESLHEAIALFRQATELDPDYALAWAGIADCYGQLSQWRYAEDEQEALRLGREAADRALEINPRLVEGYKALGLVLRQAGDREGGRAALRKAIEVNPGFSPALINLAVETFEGADLAATERLIRRVIELDDREAFAFTWLSFLTKLTSREEESLAHARRVRQISSDPFYITGVHLLLAWVPLTRGDLEAAERHRREGLEDGAEPNNMKCLEAAIAARAGRVDEARRLVKDLEDERGLTTGAQDFVAQAAIRIGDLDAAVRVLGRGRAIELWRMTARLEPALHPLLDREPYAPRRREATLVWPLEAPMIDAARHALFREVKIESGLPQGSDLKL